MTRGKQGGGPLKILLLGPNVYKEELSFQRNVARQSSTAQWDIVVTVTCDVTGAIKMVVAPDIGTCETGTAAGTGGEGQLNIIYGS